MMQEFLEKIKVMADESNSADRLSMDVARATMIHIRDNVLFELSSKNAVDEALKELDKE